MRLSHRIPGLARVPNLPNFPGGVSLSALVAALLASGTAAVWLDPSDLSTLFQDDAGTTPVTAAGQSVGMVRDKSGRGNHATQSIFASRPIYQADSGGRGYLLFDGVDDFLVTPTITPGTDKAQVFAGVRKLADAARSMVCEGSGATGVYRLEAPTAAAPTYGAGYQGANGLGRLAASSGFAAPITNVVSGILELAAPLATLRVNAAQVAQNSEVTGGGNFSASPSYIGRRNGGTLPFNGRLYGLILRFGANLTADQISQTESWMAQRTGVVL